MVKINLKASAYPSAKIVQVHGGYIEAVQGENGGAVFNILLPESTGKHALKIQ